MHVDERCVGRLIPFSQTSGAYTYTVRTLQMQFFYTGKKCWLKFTLKSTSFSTPKAGLQVPPGACCFHSAEDMVLLWGYLVCVLQSASHLSSFPGARSHVS